ncbi:unnamed protein product [Polarella glacialis]|uniref:Uncharacterized protein n=1 Tax=Polarella glacialis TaxID=89957 RepID=A0A813HB21_POLGL|nr:unnamed protein product [Polarella glacialis]
MPIEYKKDDPTVALLRDSESFLQKKLDLQSELALLLESASIKHLHKAAGSLDNKVQIVVTRAGEDVRWLDMFQDVPTVLYNRAGSDTFLPTPRSNLVVVVQKNEGREDESMMHHIVTNYDSLAEVTVFLQGWPFVHCPGLETTVRRVVAAMLKPDLLITLQGGGGAKLGLAPIAASFWEYSLPDGLLGLATQLAERHLPFNHEAEAKKFATEMYNQTCSAILGGRVCPSHQWTAEGAQWAVSRERILQQPKQLYENAIQLGEGYEKKFRGLVLEALWPIIWGETGWEPAGVTFYGRTGMASNHSSSVGRHCEMDNGKKTLLFSCEERMAFCELNDRKTGSSPSAEFVSHRQDFQISDQDHSSNWSMVAELGPVLFGSATFTPSLGLVGANHQLPNFLPIIVQSGGSSKELKLEPMDSDAGPAVRWTITEEKSGDDLAYHFSAPNGYLGCDPVTGIARLSDEKAQWKITPLISGWSQLTSAQGKLNLRRQDGGQLVCIKDQPENAYNESTFMISLKSRMV